MICQTLFSEKKIEKYDNMSSAELAQRMVKLKCGILYKFNFASMNGYPREVTSWLIYCARKESLQ